MTWCDGRAYLGMWDRGWQSGIGISLAQASDTSAAAPGQTQIGWFAKGDFVGALDKFENISFQEL